MNRCSTVCSQRKCDSGNTGYYARVRVCFEVEGCAGGSGGGGSGDSGRRWEDGGEVGGGGFDEEGDGGEGHGG